MEKEKAKYDEKVNMERLMHLCLLCLHRCDGGYEWKEKTRTWRELGHHLLANTQSAPYQ